MIPGWLLVVVIGVACFGLGAALGALVMLRQAWSDVKDEKQ
jgi:uncharacterized membrane protein YesL